MKTDRTGKVTKQVEVANHHGDLSPCGALPLHSFRRSGSTFLGGSSARTVVPVAREVIAVSVPAGADGKVWSFTPHAHGHLWFFNVPNVLAASPGSLPLPKGLVAADGLPTPKN